MSYMNYKERYEVALERAKEIHNKTEFDYDKGMLEKIFPELTESEDELSWLTKYIGEEAHNLSIDIRDYEDRIKLKNLQRSLAWLRKQGEQASPIKWHDVSSVPQEMQELLVEWDSEDASWHDVAFYHADTKTFQNYEHQIKGVTRWCYIKDLLGKQDKKEPVNEAKDYNGIDPHFEL